MRRPFEFNATLSRGNVTIDSEGDEYVFRVSSMEKIEAANLRLSLEELQTVKKLIDTCIKWVRND